MRVAEMVPAVLVVVLALTGGHEPAVAEPVSHHHLSADAWKHWCADDRGSHRQCGRVGYYMSSGGISLRD